VAARWQHSRAVSAGRRPLAASERRPGTTGPDRPLAAQIALLDRTDATPATARPDAPVSFAASPTRVGEGQAFSVPQRPPVRHLCADLHTSRCELLAVPSLARRASVPPDGRLRAATGCHGPDRSPGAQKRPLRPALALT